MSRVQKLIRLHGSNEISNLISLVVHCQDFLPSFERVRVLAHTREPPAVEFKLTPPPPAGLAGVEQFSSPTLSCS